MQRSPLYTILFAAAVCGVCSVLVAASAVALKGRQDENRLLERRRQVLVVAGLVSPDERLAREEIAARFEASVRSRVIDLATGASVDAVDPEAFDPRRAATDPHTSRLAPENDAGVRRLPVYALVYEVARDDGARDVILPIEGQGLWSTMYGFLALAADGRTVRGITFYEHGETPGLGGEVDNPRWKALWPGRLAFDEQGVPRIEVIRGVAGPPAEDPYRVDGLSGATITGRGVTRFVRFWLGEHGFGPYLERFVSEGNS